MSVLQARDVGAEISYYSRRILTLRAQNFSSIPSIQLILFARSYQINEAMSILLSSLMDVPCKVR